MLGTDTTNPATLLSGRYRPEQIPSLSGRTAVVTGGSSGIGYYDALALARAGAKVLIISATPEHGLQAESEMNELLKKDASDAGSVKWYGVDLGDLKAVDELMKKIAGEEERMDILINNGGIGQGPYGLTKDKLENHYAVNDLSHYVITLRLLPLMQKTARMPSTVSGSVRIVMQTSELHRMAPSDVKFASVEEINEKRDPVVAYGRSKLGLIYLTRQLVKRKLSSPDNTVLVASCHPGTVDTDMQEAWAESYGLIGQAIDYATRKVAKSAPEGAEASLWLATWNGINAGNLSEYQGNYYSEAFGKPMTESALAMDENISDAFWNLSASCARNILGEELM